MNLPPVSPVAAAYKDRSSGLAVLGAFELLLGCGFVLLIALMFWGQSLSAQMGAGPANFRFLLPSLVMYGLLALGLFCLGIGSFRCRRWARALSLIVAWSWLLVGLVSIVGMALILPKTFAAPPAGPAPLIIFAGVFVVMGFLMVLIPLGLILFYRSPHVRATCEAAQQQPDWTDACPLPVLAVSLWLVFGALTMVTMPLAYAGVAPLFGVLVSGWAGSAFWLAFAVLWTWLAWAVYRLRSAGWWVLTGTLVVFAISSALTFARVDLMEMYRQMGFPEEQIRQIQQTNMFTGSIMLWWTLGWVIPILGYLLWVRRFFRPGGQPGGRGDIT